MEFEGEWYPQKEKNGSRKRGFQGMDSRNVESRFISIPNPSLGHNNYSQNFAPPKVPSNPLVSNLQNQRANTDPSVYVNSESSLPIGSQNEDFPYDEFFDASDFAPSSNFNPSIESSVLLQPIETQPSLEHNFPLFGLPPSVRDHCRSKGIFSMHDWQRECLGLPEIQNVMKILQLR